MALDSLIQKIKKIPKLTGFAIYNSLDGKVLMEESMESLDSLLVKRLLDIAPSIAAASEKLGDDISIQIDIESRIIHLIKAGRLLAIIVRKP